MPALRIPERYKPGLAIIARLSTSSFQELVTATEQASPDLLGARDLQESIASHVKDIPSQDLERVIQSVVSFYRLQFRPGLTIPKLASDLAKAAKEDIDGLETTNEAELEARLNKLLALSTFNIRAIKARELQHQSERILSDARVITDIRPVFGNNFEDIPTMIIVNTLKITAHEGGEHKELYFALDAADIASLIKTLERAQDKTRSLKALLDAKGLRIVDLE
jgi:hypothetical protein